MIGVFCSCLFCNHDDLSADPVVLILTVSGATDQAGNACNNHDRKRDGSTAPNSGDRPWKLQLNFETTPATIAASCATRNHFGFSDQCHSSNRSDSTGAFLAGGRYLHTVWAENGPIERLFLASTKID